MNSPKLVFSFGPYTADPKTRQLHKLGVKLRLRPQPFQVLHLLLERSGEVVTREELRAQLWPSDTFVDFEHGLNTSVKELRSVLNDSAASPRFIETLPRIGYRFVAQTQRMESAGNDHAPLQHSVASVATTALHAPPQPRSIPRLGTFLALCAAALVALAAYAALSSPPEPRVSRFVADSLTERHDSFARIVTDGVRVYFLEREGDHDNLVETSLDGGKVHRVDAPFRGTRIFDTSSDHRDFLIGSFEARGTGLPLWTWPTQGGSPVRVGNVLADDATWTPNNQGILYVRGQDIHVIRRDGTLDRVLVHTPGYPRWIRWHPDGTKFIYTVTELQADARTLWISDAEGHDAHPYFSAELRAPSDCCAEWTPDGKYLVFTSNRGGSDNIWAVRQKRFWLHWRTPEPVQLTPTAHSLAFGVLVPDGTRAFAAAHNQSFDFLRYDVSSRQLMPLASPDGIFKRWFSRDGEWVVSMNLDWTLWSSRPDGSERIQLTSAPLRAAQVQWSPDGKTIAFEANSPGKPVRAYSMNARGGPLQEILPLDGEQSVPAWSPDGSKIAVAMNVDAPSDSTLPRGIYWFDLRAKNSEKLPGSEGLTSPQWSPDGKYFIAKAADESAILSFDLQTRRWSEIASGASFSGVNWSPDSQSIFAQKRSEPGLPIYRFPVRTFKPERLVSFESWFKSGVSDCLFEGFLPDGSLVVRNSRTLGEIFVFDLDLP